MKPRRWLSGICALAVLALAGCGSSRSGTNPPGDTATAVAATVARFYDGLRRADPHAVLTTLAPDYQYNGFDATGLANAFDIPFGLYYQSLNTRIESITTVGSTATATVTTNFQGNLNLEFSGDGRPPVNGTSRQVLELEPRGTEWRLTAFRPVHTQFSNPQTVAPGLADIAANGATSLRVAPGAPVTIGGKATTSFYLIGLLGPSFQTADVDFDVRVPFELHVVAPRTPGRFLAVAFAYTNLPSPATGTVYYLAGDLITLPVTVVAR